MSRLPRITGKELVAALQRLGFNVIRVNGSHHHLHKFGSNLVTMPIHAGEILSPMIIKSVEKGSAMSTTLFLWTPWWIGDPARRTNDLIRTIMPINYQYHRLTSI